MVAPKALTDNDRPIFGLRAVLDSTDDFVVVVEGEKKVLACSTPPGPTETFCCWAGGANTPHLTDWTPLAERECPAGGGRRQPEQAWAYPLAMRRCGSWRPYFTTWAASSSWCSLRSSGSRT